MQDFLKWQKKVVKNRININGVHVSKKLKNIFLGDNFVIFLKSMEVLMNSRTKGILFWAMPPRGLGVFGRVGSPYFEPLLIYTLLSSLE